MAAFNLGNLLKEQGKLEEAAAAYQQAIDSGESEAAAVALAELSSLRVRSSE
jgi:tetratricopeptide (TPR) repeat protein